MIHDVFNEDLLTQCKESQYKGQHVELAPPPMIINEKKEYEVKEVRKHRKQGKGTQYLMHWKATEMNMTNGLQKRGCHMQERQLKTIGQGTRVETYKERGIKSHFEQFKPFTQIFKHKCLLKITTTTLLYPPLRTLISLGS